MKTKKLSDYNVWYQPCKRCGYDTAKSRKKQYATCWFWGERIVRDYSDRALKDKPKTQKG